MRIGIIVQARLKSKRLPGKVMADIGGRPMIWHVWHRLSELKLPIIVAVPEGEVVAIQAAVRPREEVFFNEGPEDDVLARYYYAAQGFALDGIMRVTGDCPLIDPGACRRVLEAFQTASGFEYVANDIYPTYPDGLGCELFTFAALERGYRGLIDPKAREHVDLRKIAVNKNCAHNIACRDKGLPDVLPKLSVDTQEELDFIRAIDAAGPRDFSLASTLEAIERAQAENHA